MLRPSQILRLVHINLVLARHRLDEVVLATHLFRPLRFTRHLAFWRWFQRDNSSRGERIRRTLEDLGPIFIKFGQILSTRRDLLPVDIADELTHLQDRVPPFPGEQARAIVERAYRKPIDEVFASFEIEPLASASIAQVHVARLHDGREVVVKVARPGIEKTIRRDLELMYTVADLAERYWSEGKRLHPREVVAEFEKNLIDELDLLREASNASQIRRNFADGKLLYIPEVHWEYTRRNVMVMERIYGIPIGDIDALRARGVNLQKLAERGVEIFFTQVFRDSFFHADMHPGNIFVDPTDPEDPRYIAIDFGIVGTLSPVDHRYLAENFLAFFNRDYRRVAQLHVESGWVPADTRLDEFEAAMRTVSEPIFERPLSEISFGALLLRLFQTGRRFDMEIQPQLVLLQKTLLNIEGLGRQLYPELDLWKTAKPFMEDWMRRQLGVSAVARRIRQQLPWWGEQLPEIPTRLARAMKDLTDTRQQLANQAEELRQLQRELRNGSRRNFAGMLGGLLILGAVIVFGMHGPILPLHAGAPTVSWALGGLGALLLLLAWPRS